IGLSKSRVSEYIKELKENGLIEVHRRGLGKTNLYTLNFTVRQKPAKKSADRQSSIYRTQ
ncbi:MAG: winged helix-turn-helix transcriptional regulator, partial [Gammaproteobacteria bacterium]|nr:winged helix-turn-helix transcriptional regulator [Gammaproteobacteria bacterium]